MDAREWDARYAATELVWSADPNQWVAEQTRALPPGRALDLACGEGRNAIWLAEGGWHVTGVDFSQVALDKASRLACDRGAETASRLAWVRDDVLTYRPAAAAFDLVLLIYLQVVPEERREVIRRAARALAPGGTLLAVAHHSENLTEGVGGPQDPDVLYSQTDVVEDLAGLEDLHVVRAEQVKRNVPDEARPALDVLVTVNRVAA